MPKRSKPRKCFGGRMKGKAWRGSEVHYGDYRLRALEPACITSRQIEAARRAIVRHVRPSGGLWIRISPDKPGTMKPAETRMAGGELSKLVRRSTEARKEVVLLHVRGGEQGSTSISWSRNHHRYPAKAHW